MRTKKFIKDSLLVTFLGLCSKLLGWLRDSFILMYLGTGAFSDAFSLSIKIPNAFRKAVSEGAINNVLLPKLRDLEKEGVEARICALILNVFMIFSTFLLIFYFAENFFQSFFLSKIAPGFNEQQIAFYVKFVKITSFTSFIYFCYSILSSVLQAKGHFFWPSFAVSVLNFCLVFFISFGLYFNIPVENIVYFYYISTILMLFTTLIPAIFYRLFLSSTTIKRCFGLALITFISLFIFCSKTVQFFLGLFFIGLYSYFAIQNNFFSNTCLKDLRSFFYLFFPVFLISCLTQINDVVAMTFGSFFPVGSMTMIMRSGKVMQLPIAFIVPVFITLFSYLNQLSDDKKNQLFLKRISFLFVFSFALLFSCFCFYFTDLLIRLTFLFKISENDVVIMAPLVRLYAFALPALLMNRMFQMFFFVEKEVMVPAFIALNNTVFYVVFMNLFTSYRFVLSSIVIPFSICSWMTFSIYLFLAKKRNLI